MSLFTFPWGQKKNRGATSVATVRPASSYERRRAVRIAPCDIQCTFVFSTGERIAPKVLNMSTLGMGVNLPSEPSEEKAKVIFREPELIQGLEIDIQKVRCFSQSTATENSVQVGYEFIFSSNEQQTRLLRWLATQLQEEEEVVSEAQAKKSAGSYSANFYSDLSTKWSIRFPSTSEEYDQALKLIDEITVYHALMQTKYFLIFHRSKIVGLIPLVADTRLFALRADRIYPEHLRSLRSLDRRVGEIFPAYFAEDEPSFKNPASAHLQKLRVLFSLMPYLITYTKNMAHLTDLVVLVPPHLEEFYRLWLFKELGAQAKYVTAADKTIHKGYRLMSLNLKSFYDALPEERPELGDSLKQTQNLMHEKSFFQDSFYPAPEQFTKWFIQTTPAFAKLNADQLAYFRSIHPQLSLR